MTTERVLASGEVAYVCRQALGPSVRGEWSDCLTDMRIGKTKVNGRVLLPVCKIHDGKAWRPGYRWSDVADFIRAVSKANPEAKARVPMQSKFVELDPSEDGYSWRVRKIKTKATMILKPGRAAVSAQLTYWSSK